MGSPPDSCTPGRSHIGSPNIPIRRVNLLSFHSRRSLSVSVLHVILGLPGPRFPSICISQTVLIAPLDHSMCPNQRSLFSLKITLRSSISSRASRSLFDRYIHLIKIFESITKLMPINVFKHFICKKMSIDEN